MKDSIEQQNVEQECRRLTAMVANDKGTSNLSQTELAFYQTFCESRKADSIRSDIVFADTSGIDESEGNDSNNLISDPDAGRPDDSADANPAAPDPAITRE